MSKLDVFLWLTVKWIGKTSEEVRLIHAEQVPLQIPLSVM